MGVIWLLFLIGHLYLIGVWLGEHQRTNQCWIRSYVKCVLFIVNIYNGIKESTYGYQNCNISQILIFGGYFKESLYTRVIIWINTILNLVLFNDIDVRVILSRYESFCMVYRSEWYQKSIILIDTK